jgi:uncharacterized protein (DUF1015 family)
MVRIFRFPAIRPETAMASSIASVPYDVVNADEAAEIIAKNPLSFLRVSRSDAELPEVPAHDSQIYARARENFIDLMKNGILRKDQSSGYYLYRVTDGGRVYTGLVCCVSVDEYLQGNIRRHELTRYDKEEDRTRHIDAINAQSGLVFLIYRDTGDIYRYIESIVVQSPPDAEVTANNSSVHQVFRITDETVLAALEALMDPVPSLYIADGHHRAASAVNVAQRRRKEGAANEECGHFMAVLFAHDRVRIHGYSRLVADLNGQTPAALLSHLREAMQVRPYGPINGRGYHIPPHHPAKGMHIFHMYLDGMWYEIATPVNVSANAIESLDVTVLQQQILEEMLGVTDPRADPRLQYMGGAKPLTELERMVDDGHFAVAFAMQPLRIEQVLSIADNGGVMPPKSTWFEPKLLSGLIVHSLD